MINVLVCASLLVLASACGKEGKKSSSKNSNPYYGGYNPITTPGTYSGEAALKNLKAWLSVAELPNLGYRGTFVKKTEEVDNFTFQGSLCFFGKGINCSAPAPTNCYKLNVGTNSYDLGTATGSGLNDCSITQSNVTKATNQALQAAVTGNGYQLLQIQQQGKVFYLIYGYANVPQVLYVIDTNYHSIINPIEVREVVGNDVVKTQVSHLYTYGM